MIPTTLAAGSGLLRISRVAGRSVATRVRATDPLKLLVPRRRRKATWAYVANYGGGLVEGDVTDVELALEEGTACVLGTQSATKVYKSSAGVGCRQRLRAKVAAGSLLVLAPDPLICFQDAILEQTQEVRLAEGASLVALDWLTSGRRDRDECWAFSRFFSRLDVYRHDDLTLRESLLLDRELAPPAPGLATGGRHCVAFLVAIGGRVVEEARRWLEPGGGSAEDGDAELIEAASPIRDGVVVRIVGATPERVRRVLRERLAFLRKELGDEPWARKW